jgi:hypothetical protein
MREDKIWTNKKGRLDRRKIKKHPVKGALDKNNSAFFIYWAAAYTSGKA